MSHEPIIKVLKSRREAAGLSQQQIADLAGMSKRTYQRIEQGDSDMKLSQYRAIIRALKATNLDISLDALELETTNWDVASAARGLPPTLRQHLVRLLMELHREFGQLRNSD